MNVSLQAGKLGLDPVEILLGASHVDVGLGAQPARPAHLLGEGAPMHLGGLQVPSVQHLQVALENKLLVQLN